MFLNAGVYNVNGVDKIQTSVTARSNLNRAQSEKNTYRCSIKSRSPQSWLMFALAHIVCRATTVANGNTVHSRFQEPVAMQPTEYFPNQTMPSPHLIPLAHAKSKLTTLNTMLAINFRHQGHEGRDVVDVLVV